MIFDLSPSLYFAHNWSDAFRAIAGPEMPTALLIWGRSSLKTSRKVSRKFLQYRSGRLSAPRSKLPRSYNCLCFPFICSSHAISNGPAEGDAVCAAATPGSRNAATPATETSEATNQRRLKTSGISVLLDQWLEGRPALPAPPARNRQHPPEA